jgi:hypothetical protein
MAHEITIEPRASSSSSEDEDDSYDLEGPPKTRMSDHSKNVRADIWSYGIMMMDLFGDLSYRSSFTSMAVSLKGLLKYQMLRCTAALHSGTCFT